MCFVSKFLEGIVSLLFVFSFHASFATLFLELYIFEKAMFEIRYLEFIEIFQFRANYLKSFHRLLNWPSTKKKKMLIWRKKEMAAFLLKILHPSLTYRNSLSPWILLSHKFLAQISIIRADKYLILKKKLNGCFQITHCSLRKIT